MSKFYFSIFSIFLFLVSTKVLSQCTPEKEPEMQKYLNLTQTTDAQGCSQCGMLALYFCSARYCVKPDDVQKVGQLINACKQNIINMGQPYCCPDYINKQPEWGIMGASNATTNTTSGSSNPMLNTASSDADANKLLNALNSLNSSSGDVSNFTKNYVQGQQIAEVATGLIDLFTPSPEEKARKEQQRLAAEKSAEEYRNAQLKLSIENEQNAKSEFNNYLKKYPPTNSENKNTLIVNIMDNYMSNKYNYDVSGMIPEWKNWVKESINNNDKFITTVFAGKKLGFNFNKFQYNIDITEDESIKLLEKVANSDIEMKPYVGLSYDIVIKKITEKNKKKKAITKEFNTFKVSQVKAGSSAENAGLTTNDVILKINNSYQDNFAEIIQKSKIGDKVSITILRDSKEITKEITIGSAIKDIFKVDAILILANYYNIKEKGNDPEKALYYFTKAAENGSPNAMFALGEIYQNNIFGNKKLNVKFKFKKNEEFALEWYIKSIQNINYQSSSIYSIYKIGSAFEPSSYDELITMYKKGIGCKKSPEKAEEILSQKNVYLEKINSTK